MALLSKDVVTVATCLTKFNIDNQSQLIENWRHAGLTIISVNSPSDVDILGPRFSDVAFAIDINAYYEPDGICYVHLDRLIQVLSASKGEVCGIIRPDLPFDCGMVQTMLNNAKSSIPSADRLMKQIQQFGIFFFCRNDAAGYLPTKAAFRC